MRNNAPINHFPPTPFSPHRSPIYGGAHLIRAPVNSLHLGRPPLSLGIGRYENLNKKLVIACTDKRYESGRGQPHSKTLRKKQRAEKRASVLECGCSLPLFGVARTCAIRH